MINSRKTVVMVICNCGKEFESQRSRNSHARFCSQYVKKKVPTKYLSEGVYTCECKRRFEKHQSLNSHFSRCLIHRNGLVIVERKHGGGWSKGLTRETHPGVKRWHDASVLARKGKPGKKHTAESRKILSERRIAYLENSPHVKWFEVSNGVRLVKVQGDWERRVAEWLNTNNIKWDRKRINFDGHRTYTPDFWLSDLDIFLEVKGWLSDRDDKKMKKVIGETGIKIKLITKEHMNNLDELNLESICFFE